ncbi:Kelch motif protein [compost metagenome]
MIVWGGANGLLLQTGGNYDPLSNTWSEVGTRDAPVARYYHSAVWTDTKMIVWGGYGVGSLSDGKSYLP